MRYFELCEATGSNAPLYHATSFAAAEEILRNDKLAGRTTQLVDARRGRRRVLKKDEWTGQKVYVYDMKGGRHITGVSLTRDTNFAASWKQSAVILVLDQAKLTQRYKMIPLDHVRSSRYDYSSPGVIFDKDWMYQAEEFVPGDIAPLSRYLLSVNVRLRDLDPMTLMDREEHAIIFQHPLLNRLIPRGQRREYERQPHVRAYGYGPDEEDEGHGYYNRLDPNNQWRADWRLAD